jgi:tricorn protease-like protein
VRIIRRRVVAALLMWAGLFIFIVILRSLQMGSSASLGHLVFTDYPKPDRRFTVDVFDIEQGKRSSLEQEPYQDMGSLFPIDAQDIYTSVCFARIISGFCLSPVNTTITPKNILQLANIKLVWKDNYGSPVWSPDGTHIAFSVVDKGTQNASIFTGDTYVMNADGTKIVDLTPSENINGLDFAWSPDSQQIAFACSNAQYLCMSHVDGSHLLKLSMPPYTTVHDMDWSPDGSQIAFSLTAADFHNSELYLVNTDGTNLHRLLETASGHYDKPKWSPDGSKIAFANEEGGRKDVYIITPDGTNFHNLTQGLGGLDFGTVWSPDSMNIAFFSWQLEQGIIFLYVADASRGNRQKITDNLSLGMTDAVTPVLFWIP